MEVVLGGLVGGPGGIPVEALHKACSEVQGDPEVLGNLPGHLALVQGKAASTSRLKKRENLNFCFSVSTSDDACVRPAAKSALVSGLFRIGRLIQPMRTQH